MTTPKKPDLFEHFAQAGYAVIVFDDQLDAQKAGAILRQTDGEVNNVPLFTADEVIDEIAERQAHQSLADFFGYGFDSESLEQLRDLALQGCTFLSVYMASRDEEDNVMNAIRSHHPRIVRKYGTFVIRDVPQH